jgi:hypothetical protein
MSTRWMCPQQDRHRSKSRIDGTAAESYRRR